MPPGSFSHSASVPVYLQREEGRVPEEKKREKRARYEWRAREVDFRGKNWGKFLLNGRNETQPSRPGGIGMCTWELGWGVPGTQRERVRKRHGSWLVGRKCWCREERLVGEAT